MGKSLKLTIKKDWFDKIKSGEKTEEYREIKPYWIDRLLDWYFREQDNHPKSKELDRVNNSIEEVYEFNKSKFKSFDSVEFRNGYQKNAPFLKMEFKGIEIGKPTQSGKNAFKYRGSNLCDVFIIKLGKELSRSNCG